MVVYCLLILSCLFGVVHLCGFSLFPPLFSFPPFFFVSFRGFFPRMTSPYQVAFFKSFLNLNRFDNTKVGTKKPKEVSPEVINKIKQKNAMDIELYEMAKKIFEQQIDEVGRYLVQKEVDSN